MANNLNFETAIWAMKLVLFSVGIISTLIFFKVVIIPYIFSVFGSLPNLWISMRIWLSPPYIYILVNFIIIIIAASNSSLQNFHFDFNKLINRTVFGKTSQSSNREEDNNNISRSSSHEMWDEVFVEYEYIEEIVKLEKPTSMKLESVLIDTDLGESKIHNDKTIEEKTCFDINPKIVMSNHREIKLDCLEPCSETVIEKSTSDETKDTLDDTWNFIKEGKGKTNSRHLRKSETWETPPCVVVKLGSGGDEENDHDPVSWAKKELRKSDTFNDRMSLRRDKSMSQDELNRRSEAFIKKIFHDIKLERQESDQRYMEMVNRQVR